MEAKKYLPATFLIIESIFLVYFSVIPYREPLPGEPDILRQGYLEHFLAYLVYGGLVFLTTRNMAIKNRILLAVLIGSAFGASMEIVQSFVPNRSPDAADWMVDTLGAGVGGLACWRLFWKKSDG